MTKPVVEAKKTRRTPAQMRRFRAQLVRLVKKGLSNSEIMEHCRKRGWPCHDNYLATARKVVANPPPQRVKPPVPGPPKHKTGNTVQSLLRLVHEEMQSLGIQSLAVNADGSFTVTRVGEL